MALWKDESSPRAPEPAAKAPEKVAILSAVGESTPRPAPVPTRADMPAQLKESVISAGLTIEGKIEGAGNVRISGDFKGDVNVQGDLSLERGAKLNGGVRAKKVVVAGELEGNIESAARVELLDTAVMIGDLKAGTLTVAAGSKIRGHIDCGWETGAAAPKPAAKDAAAES